MRQAGFGFSIGQWNAGLILANSMYVEHFGHFSALKQGVNLTWMPKVENQHDNKHKSRIQHIEENLLALQVPILALDIFDDTIYATHKNDSTNTQKYGQMFLPRSVHRSACGAPLHAEPERDDVDEEEAEEKDLNAQPEYDNRLPSVRCPRILFGENRSTYSAISISTFWASMHLKGLGKQKAGKYRTSSLGYERDDVSAYEELRKPLLLHNRMHFSI